MPIGNIGFNTVSKLGGVKKQAAKAPIQLQSSETFRGSNAYVIAKDFKNNAAKVFSDFQTGLPKDGEKGCKVLEKTLTPYAEQIKTLTKSEVEHFTKLIGNSTLEIIESGSLGNTTVKGFKEVLEQGMGKTIKEVLKNV